MENPDIVYTKVDEAPELASASFLPIIKTFAAAAGVSVGTRDISLAGRIIAAFPDNLSADQKQSDDLAILGELVKTPDANVIKLPNISASVPQLVAAVEELQSQGYKIPDYPEAPANDAEKAIRARFDAIKGSAVNPVLREGNSDRRAAVAVKNYAQANPHRMGVWAADSKTHVSTMSANDFRSNETSATLTAAQAGPVRIELEATDGTVTVLKDGVDLPAGAVVDATFMSAKALQAFLIDQVAETKAKGVLFSIHLKATMMKVSDPIIFGHAVKAFLKPVFDKYGCTWSIPTRASPTSTCRPTSSSMRPFPHLFALAERAGALMEKRPTRTARSRTAPMQPSMRKRSRTVRKTARLIHQLPEPCKTSA